jgi:cytochrome c
MSSMEFNKAVGAVLLVALAVMVFGYIGNSLVKPKSHEAAKVKVAASSEKRAAKAAPLQPISPLLASANAANGAVVFKKCAVCHTSAKGDKNKLGPNLWNIVNAPHAGKAGFKYSKALKKKPGNWTFEGLNEFLVKPKAYVPGTKMGFAGLKKANQRADLILYLTGLSDSPAKLP